MNGVKFVLFTFVAVLVSAGIFSTAADNVGSPTAPRGEKNHSVETRQPFFTPPNGRILASLRFWEKPKNQPQQSAAATSVPSRSEETTGAKESAANKQSDISALSRTTDTAPQPSPNPETEREAMGFGDAPLPAGHASHTHEPVRETSQETQSAMASYLSYSFDTRDWVEFFPHPQEQAFVPEDALATTQPTSLRSPLPNPTLYQNQSSDANDQWDGQATTLIAPAPTAIVTAEPPHVADISPSYGKRLPHVQTYGAVVVQANFPLTEIAAILEEINQLQYDLNRYVGVTAPREKIELCLFKNEESYINFLREFFPKAPRDRRALYVKLDGKPGTLMVQQSNDFEIDLRHEMTHAILHASITKVPIWLDEGLAKYFEVPSRDRAGNHPYSAQIRWNAKLGVVPSLDRLSKLETIDDMGAKEYRDSWAWAHFLIHRSPETHRLLAAYLQMLENGGGTEVEKQDVAEFSLTGGKNLLALVAGQDKKGLTPSLKPYLDDIMTNQRETFKEHFGAAGK